MSFKCWTHFNTQEHFTPEKHINLPKGKNLKLLNPNLHWLLGRDFPPPFPSSSLALPLSGYFSCIVSSWDQGLLESLLQFSVPPTVWPAFCQPQGRRREINLVPCALSRLWACWGFHARSLGTGVPRLHTAEYRVRSSWQRHGLSTDKLTLFHLILTP